MKRYKLSRNFENDSYRLRMSAKTKKGKIILIASEIIAEVFEKTPIKNTRFIRKIMVKELNNAVNNPLWYITIKPTLQRFYYKIRYNWFSWI